MSHRYAPYERQYEARENPLQQAVQRSFGMKFCCKCKADRPSKGSKKIGEGMWSCSLHRKPDADLSGLALRLVNPVSGV